VTFKPTKTGTLTADLVILDNATGSPQFSTLSGSVVAGPPVVSLTPASLKFASTPEGETTAAQVVTLKNTGESTLTLASGAITITGTDASSFVKSATTCGTTLAAGASCTISVEMKPATTGALTASLNVADNAAGSPQKVTLSGTGTAAAPTVSLAPGTTTFANTVIGVPSAAQTLTLTNTGKSTVTISSIVVTGTNASSFYDVTTCTGTLAAGASCPIAVVFKPTAAEALTAKVVVTDTAAGSPQAATLDGTGIKAPTVSVTPATLAFGTEAVGTSTEAKAVTVKNTGTSPLTITGVTLGGTNPTSFLLANECGSPLASGASCTIYVALHPAAKGALKATLSIADNAAGSPQSVALTGTGD
jgi:hypothetical protein